MLTLMLTQSIMYDFHVDFDVDDTTLMLTYDIYFTYDIDVDLKLMIFMLWLYTSLYLTVR
jgi:hypothetical protein